MHGDARALVNHLASAANDQLRLLQKAVSSRVEAPARSRYRWPRDSSSISTSEIRFTGGAVDRR